MWKQSKKQGRQLTQPTVKEYGTLEKSFTNTDVVKKIGQVIKSTKDYTKNMNKENNDGTT